MPKPPPMPPIQDNSGLTPLDAGILIGLMAMVVLVPLALWAVGIDIPVKAVCR